MKSDAKTYFLYNYTQQLETAIISAMGLTTWTQKPAIFNNCENHSYLKPFNFQMLQQYYHDMYCLLLYILLILTFLYIKATSKDRDERYCYSYFMKEENKILKTLNLPYGLVSDRTRLRCRLTNSKFSLFTILDIRKPIYWFFIVICHSVKWTLTHMLMEKEMVTHSSIYAWRIPGTEELSIGSHRVRHDWSDLAAAALCSGSKELNFGLNFR